MRKLLFLFSLCLMSCVPVVETTIVENDYIKPIGEEEMANNVVPLDVVTKTWSYSPNLTNPTYAYDNDDNTYAGASNSGHNSAPSSVLLSIDLGRVIDVSRIRVVYDNDYNISTLYNNNSHFILSYSTDGNTYTTITTLFRERGKKVYDDSTVRSARYIRVSLYSDVSGEGIITTHSRLYELQVWGDVWLDSGFRIKTASGVVTLAREPTLSGPLRFRKGGVTYSFALVDTTDSSASPVRIKTAAGIKAIAKL